MSSYDQRKCLADKAIKSGGIQLSLVDEILELPGVKAYTDVSGGNVRLEKKIGSATHVVAAAKRFAECFGRDFFISDDKS